MADEGDTIGHVAVVILLLALAVPALATAYDYAGTPTAYSEDLTVDYNNASAVSESATLEGYGDEETITADGDQLVEGVDYDWNTTAGEVTWYNTSNTTAGETATIDYRAYQRTGETEAAWTLITPFMGLFGVFGIVVSVRAILHLLAEVWT